MNCQKLEMVINMENEAIKTFVELFKINSKNNINSAQEFYENLLKLKDGEFYDLVNETWDLVEK